jgi:hypothetical protein
MEFAREQTLRAEAELLAGEKRRREEMRWRDEVAEEERREKRREKREARERKERMEDQKARDRERERERGDTPEYTYTYTYSNHGNGNGSRQHTHGSTLNVNVNSTAARRKEQDRQRYLSRWKSLLANTSSSDDEIIEVELTYSDIPWPIYNPSSSSSSSHLLDKLTKESIKTFLSDLSATSTGTSTGGKHEMKRILREAIKNFHPDRFTSKVLIRVRGEEREKVREGMEICSRALTDLIGENARS